MQSLVSRIPKRFTKRITFDGSAGGGAIGTVLIGTVTGAITILRQVNRCLTDLVGSSATIEMGVPGNTAALVAQTTAENLDAGEFWQDATPEVGVSPAACVNQNVGAATRNGTIAINITVATANVTAGAMDIDIEYISMSDAGYIA